MSAVILLAASMFMAVYAIVLAVGLLKMPRWARGTSVAWLTVLSLAYLSYRVAQAIS